MLVRHNIILNIAESLQCRRSFLLAKVPAYNNNNYLVTCKEFYNSITFCNYSVFIFKLYAFILLTSTLVPGIIL